MAELPLTYFLKELLSNPIRQRNGASFPWDDVGDDIGVIATTDANLVFELSAYESTHTGGVVRIDEVRYQELKKNSNSTEYGRRCASRTQSQLVADQPHQWLVSDPAAVAVSAAQGKSDVFRFEAPVMKKAMETVSVPETHAAEAVPAAPTVSPSKVVRRGRANKPSA